MIWKIYLFILGFAKTNYPENETTIFRAFS